MSWKEDLFIDLAKLHLEVRAQPRRLMKYATEWAEAKRYAALLERRVKVVRAQTAKELRKNNPKLSNEPIKELVEEDPGVEAAELAAINAQYEASVLWGAVEAFRGRKSQLEKAVELYKMGYYSLDLPLDDVDFVTGKENEEILEGLQDQQVVLEEMKKELTR